MVAAPRRLVVVALLAVALSLPGEYHSPQEHRQQIVAMIKSHDLVEEQSGDLAVPAGMGDATFFGAPVWVRRKPALTVFFVTQVFFSPDPYCGYEYAEGIPEVDPLKSGTGKAEPVGGNWYWICAS